MKKPDVWIIRLRDNCIAFDRENDLHTMIRMTRQNISESA